VVVAGLPGLVVPQEHPRLALQEVSSLELVKLENSREWREDSEKNQIDNLFLLIRTVKKKTELSLKS
jgi:hypothetical protein